MDNKIYILDTSLRDGAQAEGVSFSVEDKLAVMEYLDAIGVDYVEGGNPASNPKDAEFFRRAADTPLKHARLCAFTSTHKAGVSPQQDGGIRETLQSGAKVVVVFGKAWDMHVSDILSVEPEQNIAIIKSTVQYFVKQGLHVIFDAEHFYDGHESDAAYAMSVLEAALQSGADCVTLCDTNGGRLTRDIDRATSAAVRLFGRRVAVHCHNDMGLAVANTIAAVEAGASAVHGTFGGFGERCGNADLAAVIANLQLKLGYHCIPPENMGMLTLVNRAVYAAANVAPNMRQPYVGASAFAHKGGMHIDAVIKKPCSYEHIEPGIVGNERRFLLSEVAGRSALLPVLQSVNPSLKRDSPETALILEQMKSMEHYGYEYEGAEASLEMLIQRALGRFTPHFVLESYRVSTDRPISDTSSSAIMKIKVGGETEITAAEGDGPVNALDKALRKALARFYPRVNGVRLSDYKVRVLDGKSATAAVVRVVITTTDGVKSWRTVGASTDIIEASWIALLDSIEYFLASNDCG